MKNIISTLFIVLVLLTGFYLYQTSNQNEVNENVTEQDNYENAEDNKNGVSDDNDANNENKPIYDGEYSNQNDSLIVVSPMPGKVVGNPLQLSGQVRGTWLFEATAPVVLTNWDGLIIAEGYIEAEEDWMTEDFVPFSGTLEYEIPVDIGDFSDFGHLIFMKANPSGLSEYDGALEFRIRFRE